MVFIARARSVNLDLTRLATVGKELAKGLFTVTNSDDAQTAVCALQVERSGHSTTVFHVNLVSYVNLKRYVLSSLNLTRCCVNSSVWSFAIAPIN